LVSRASPKLVHVRMMKLVPSLATRPRLLPNKLTMLLAVVINAVTVAEPARLNNTLIMEKARLLYMMPAEEGKRNATREPNITAELPMMLMM
jgi:hypothetical protein